MSGQSIAFPKVEKARDHRPGLALGCKSASGICGGRAGVVIRNGESGTESKAGHLVAERAECFGRFHEGTPRAESLGGFRYGVGLRIDAFPQTPPELVSWVHTDFALPRFEQVVHTPIDHCRRGSGA